MAGVHLTLDNVNALIEGMGKSCDQPIRVGSKMPDAVKRIFKNGNCLSCHSLQGKGASNGGMGGDLDQVGKMGEKKLRSWLAEPTAANARKLGISNSPTGAMASVKLDKNDRDAVVDYLMDVYNREKTSGHH